MNTDRPFLPRTFGSVSPRRRREVVSTVERPTIRPISEENRHSGLKRLKSRSWSSVRRWEKENELLFAMIEDEAEWLAGLFPEEIIAPEFFFFALEDGVLLCKLANLIQEFIVKYGKERKIEVVESNIKYHPRSKTRGQLGQFRARENVTEFLLWCRRLSVPEVILFESNDVVQTEDLRDGAREVVICLMEVARRAAKYGVQPPRLIILENEIEQEERQEKCSSPSSVDSGVETENDINSQNRHSVKIEIIIKGPEKEQNDINIKLNSSDETNSGSKANPEDKENKEKEKSLGKKDNGIDHTDNVTKPQSALDEKVLNLIKEYFVGKITRLKEGKYIILGRVMFVRMLNEHVLVRIGGGWDGLEHYLMTHVNRGSQTPHPSATQSSDSRSNTPTNLASTKHSSRHQSRTDLAASNPSLAESNKGEFRSFTPPLLPNFITRGRESPLRKTSRVKDTDEADIAKAIRRIETTVSENIHKKTSSTLSLIDITPSVENCKKCSDNRKLTPENMETSEVNNFTHTTTDASVIKQSMNTEIPTNFENLGQPNFANESDVMDRVDSESIHPVVKSDDNNNKDDISVDANSHLVNGDVKFNEGDLKVDELGHDASGKAEFEVVVTKQAKEVGKASSSVKDKKAATSSKTKNGNVTADRKGPKATSTSKTATKAAGGDKKTADATKKANLARTAAAKTGKTATPKWSAAKPSATKAAAAKTSTTKSLATSSTAKTTTTKPAPKPTATAKPLAAKAPSAKTTASKPAAKTAKGADSKAKQGADSTDGAAISKATKVTSVKTTTVTTKTSKTESAGKKPAGKNDVSKPKTTVATKQAETTATKTTKAPSAAAKSTVTKPAPAKTKTADASAKKALTETKKPATASAKPSSAPAKAAKKPAESSKPISAPAKSSTTPTASKAGSTATKPSTTATKTATTKAATTKTTTAASKAAAPKSAPPKSAASKPTPQKAAAIKSTPAAAKAAKPATKTVSATTTKSVSAKPADKKATDKKPASPAKSKAVPVNDRKKPAASSAKVSKTTTDKSAKTKKPAETKAAKAGKSPTKDSKKAPKDATKTKETESKKEEKVVDVKTDTVVVTENITVEAVVPSAIDLNEPISLQNSNEAIVTDTGIVETRVTDDMPEKNEIADVTNEVVHNELPVTEIERATVESSAVEKDIEGAVDIVMQNEAERSTAALTDISQEDDTAIKDNTTTEPADSLQESDVQPHGDYSYGSEPRESEEAVASPARNPRGETFDLEPSEVTREGYEEDRPIIQEQLEEQVESQEQFSEEQSYQMEEDEARDSESAKFDESTLMSLEEITVKCEDGDAREGAVAPTPPETPVPESVTPECQAKDSNVDLQLEIENLDKEGEEEFHARDFHPGDTPAVTPMVDSTVIKTSEEVAREGSGVELPEVEDETERREDLRQEEHVQEAGSELEVGEERETESAKEEPETEQKEDLEQEEQSNQAVIELVVSEEQNIVSTTEDFTSQDTEVTEEEERPRVEDVSHDDEFQNENDISTQEQTYRVDEISQEEERPIADAFTQPERAEEISHEESAHKDAFVQNADNDLQEETLKAESAEEMNEDTLKAVDHLATDEDRLVAATVTDTFMEPESRDMRDLEESMAGESQDVIEDKSSDDRGDDVIRDEEGVSSDSSPSTEYDTHHEPAMFSQEVEIHELAASMSEDTEEFEGQNRDDFIQDEQRHDILVPMATLEEVSTSEERPEGHGSPLKAGHTFEQDQAAFDQENFPAASPVAEERDENTGEDYGIGHRGTEELMQRGYIEDDLMEDNETRQQDRNEDEVASQNQENNEDEGQSAGGFGDYEREEEQDIAQVDVLINKEFIEEQQDVYHAEQEIETDATAAQDEDNSNAISAQQDCNVAESIAQHNEPTDTAIMQQDELFDEITVQHEDIVESQPDNLCDIYDEKESGQSSESDLLQGSINDADVVEPEGSLDAYEGQNEMMHPELGLEEQEQYERDIVRADTEFNALGSTQKSDDTEGFEGTEEDIEKPNELELENQFALSQQAEDVYTPVSDLPEGLTSPFAQISFDQFPEGKEGATNEDITEDDAPVDEDAEFDNDVLERAKENLRVAKSLDDSYEDEQQPTDTQPTNIEESDAQDAPETPAIVPQVISSPCISSESEDSDLDEEKDQEEVVARRESTVEAIADSAEGIETEVTKHVSHEDLNPFHSDEESDSADMKQDNEEEISHHENSNLTSFEQPDQAENEPEPLVTDEQSEFAVTDEQSEFASQSYDQAKDPFESEATPSELQQGFPDEKTSQELSGLYQVERGSEDAQETFQHHMQHDTNAVQDPMLDPFHEEHAQQDSPHHDPSSISHEDLESDLLNREQLQTNSSHHDSSNVEQVEDYASDSFQRQNLEQDSSNLDPSNRTYEDLEQSNHTEYYDQENLNEEFPQSSNNDEMNHDPDSPSKEKGLMSDSHYSNEDVESESVNEAESGVVHESSGEQATDGSDFVLVDSPIKHADPSNNLIDASSNLVDPEEVTLGFKQGMVASTESGSDDSPFHHIELKTDELPMEEGDDALEMHSSDADALEDCNMMPNDAIHDANVMSYVSHAADNGIELMNEDYGSTNDQLNFNEDQGAKFESANHEVKFENGNHEDHETILESRNHEANFEPGSHDFESEFSETEKHTISSAVQGDSIKTEETYTIHTTYSAQYEENTIEGASHFSEDFNPNASAAYVNNIPINSNTMATFDHHGGGENFSGPQYVYDGSDDDDETY